jgi:hypothetical protein
MARTRSWTRTSGQGRFDPTTGASVFALAYVEPGATVQRCIVDFRASGEWPATGANALARPYQAWWNMLAIAWVGDGDGLPAPTGYFVSGGEDDYLWTQQINFRTDGILQLNPFEVGGGFYSIYSNSQPSENIDSHSMRRASGSGGGIPYLVIDGDEFDLYNGEAFFFDFTYSAAVLVLEAP